MKDLPSGITIAGGVNSSGMAHSNVVNTNNFDFTADVFYQPITGSDFAYIGDFPFTLTPAGCVLTFTGPASRVVIASLAASIFQGNAFGEDTRGVAIAHNGDLLGQLITSAGALAAGVMTVTIEPNGPIYSIAANRRLSLSPGDTIQPVCASTALNEIISIHTLNLVVR